MFMVPEYGMKETLTVSQILYLPVTVQKQVPEIQEAERYIQAVH